MSSNSKPADPKSTMDPTPAPRFVPGAPPPAPLTKSQKKKLLSKRKPALGTAENRSASPEGQDGSAENGPHSAVPDTANQSDSKVPHEEEIIYKPSPIAELIGKRLKSTTKKIARISTYTTMDIEKLDDGQRQSLKTLPGLEAVQKELGEVKRAVETHEIELAHEQASKRIEAEQAEKQKFANILSDAEASYTAKVSELLSFLHFHAALSAGHSEALGLGLDEPTGAAVFAVVGTLLGSEGESKQATIRGFLSGEGDFQGTSYARLLEITQLYANPPRVPTPIPEEPEEDEAPHTEIPASMDSSIVSESEVTVGAIPPKPSTGSFHFMQASELEPSFEESAEWIERSDGAQDSGGTRDETDDPRDGLNGHNYVEEAEATKEVPASGPSPIDWADEEGGLPSIDALQANFGASGTATPVTPAGEAPEYQNIDIPNGGAANDVTAPHEGDDGFTQARGGRGRGRGFRDGDRGPMRGGFRGSGRGDRGFRGGFRGDRDRGFRGRSTPSGEWRGDGEFRGRGGRGRGRGDRGGRKEGAPPPS